MPIVLEDSESNTPIRFIIENVSEYRGYLEITTGQGTTFLKSFGEEGPLRLQPVHVFRWTEERKGAKFTLMVQADMLGGHAADEPAPLGLLVANISAGAGCHQVAIHLTPVFERADSITDTIHNSGTCLQLCANYRELDLLPTIEKDPKDWHDLSAHFSVPYNAWLEQNLLQSAKDRLDLAVDTYHNNPAASTSKLDVLFDRYKDADGDHITIHGTTKLREDLNVGRCAGFKGGSCPTIFGNRKTRSGRAFSPWDADSHLHLHTPVPVNVEELYHSAMTERAQAMANGCCDEDDHQVSVPEDAPEGDRRQAAPASPLLRPDPFDMPPDPLLHGLTPVPAPDAASIPASSSTPPAAPGLVPSFNDGLTKKEFRKKKDEKKRKK
ncbi:hypothetical protein L227DRAFT_608195 [Lentinus tigrinus ALCF2SS1-6]|uniref:Uncharacterized protein n=1 Tax=Lentinus tigrinus ALCF2SS1-6 TaxID=1328759 RepID=A0A5C2SK11_9APHY|nr:hypothetical protein L227DRAFT_608195 [Lentinus tigrinus ALCF2SS1-6]